MEMSTSIAALATALIKFQSKCPPLTLDKTVKVTTNKGANYSFKYAQLPQIVDVAKSILPECGLAYTQLVEPDGSVTTMLIHESGEYLSSNLLIKGEQTPQGIGSSISYAKRYGLAAILGMVAEEDDDANIAEGNQHTTQEDKRQWLNPGTPEWSKAIEFLKGTGTIDKILTKYKLSKANEQKLKDETLETA